MEVIPKIDKFELAKRRALLDYLAITLQRIFRGRRSRLITKFISAASKQQRFQRCSILLSNTTNFSPCDIYKDNCKYIELNIDNCINLPINCTATRVSVRYLIPNKPNIQHEKKLKFATKINAIENGSAFSSPDTSGFHPVYNYRLVYDNTQTEDFDYNRGIFLIRIDTIERPSMVAKCVGYAILPVWKEVYDVNKTEIKFRLNTGLHTLKLFYGNISSEINLFDIVDREENLQIIPDTVLTIRVSDPSHGSSKIEKFTQKELHVRNQKLDNVNYDVLLLLLSSLSTSYQGSLPCLPLLLGISHTSNIPFPPYSKTTLTIADDWLKHAFPSPTNLKSCINKANMFTYSDTYGAFLAIDAIYNAPTSQLSVKDLSDFALQNIHSLTVYKSVVQYLPGLKFNVNDLVEVNKNKKWVKGIVNSINTDGSLNITYSYDNLTEEKVPEFLVRRHITDNLRQNSLHVGASVLANYRELNKWYEGKLIAVYPHQGLSDSSEKYLYDIKYSDGVIERNVKDSCIIVNRRALINLPAADVSEEIVVEEVLSRIDCSKSYNNHHQYSTECMSSTSGVILGSTGCVLITLTAIDLLLLKSNKNNTTQRTRRDSFKKNQYPYLPDGISKLTVNIDSPTGTYWTLIPLRKDTVFTNHNKSSILSETIDIDGQFVNQGVHQLPLFEGQAPEEIIWSADPLKTLIKGLRTQARQNCNKIEKIQHRKSPIMSLRHLIHKPGKSLTTSTLLSISPVSDKENEHDTYQNYTKNVCVSNRGNNILLSRPEYTKLRTVIMKVFSYFVSNKKRAIAPLPPSDTVAAKPKYILSNGASIFVRIQDGRKFNEIPRFEFRPSCDDYNTETMSLILSAYNYCATDKCLLEELFAYVSYLQQPLSLLKTNNSLRFIEITG